MPRLFGAVALGGALAFLAAWLTHSPGVAAWVGPRMKTNTAFGLALLSLSLLLRSRPARGSRADQAGCFAALAALALAGLTLAEYAFGVDLHIDQLLARDAIVPESARFPNRMSPNAGFGIVTCGLALLVVRRPGRAWALAAHALAAVVVALGFAALLGYLYDAAVLYQPTQFIRISPFTAAGLVLVSVGTMLLRRETGVMRLLSSEDAAGFLARRLLALSVVAPVILGWLWLEAQRLRLYTPSGGTAMLVITVIGTFGGVVVLLALAVERMDARRRAVEDDLRRTGELSSALSRAATVREVVDSAVRLGLPALGATFGCVLLNEGGRLRLAQTSGYTDAEVGTFRELPIEGEYPASVAQRTAKPVFIASRDELGERFPAMREVDLGARVAWAALPLSGREETRGVLWLGFSDAQRFDAAARERMVGLAWYLGLALDRAQLFESEKSARARAEAANRTKDEFLALLGHELRNPLAPIVTSLGLMKARAPEALERERAVIERQVQHMIRLVDDLLDVARITRGKVVLRRERVELGRVVAAAVEVASPLLEQRRHRLTVAVPARGLPVMADVHRITQVVSNLLTNAAKYTDPGGLIEVSAERAGEDVSLAVRDHGIGIAAALLPRVFEQFVQGERALDRAQGGLGLGLSIARSLVLMHGGTIRATSEGSGRGSEFTVTLPLDRSKPITEAHGVAEASSQSAATEARRHARVLVIDDNTDAADLLAEALRIDGHEVRLAYDGPSGLRAAEEFHPEVAFVDIGLPVMDGYEVAQRLRQASNGKALTLVAVTGYGQESDRDRSLAAGFDRHLVKPVDLDQVLAVAAGRSASV